ncbi:MAG: substrate-binding domain-containing protein [Cyclobacteriaceae bacterium]|nr:substrate-binding domain-containing protein [Cyclobacteriaceae bacterium HetDA_MAG_MS6]
MTKHEFKIRTVSLLVLLTFLASCGQETNRESYKIGFSQCIFPDDLWRVQMISEMERELLFHEEISMEVRFSGHDNEKQLRHVREFIRQGVDLIIVSPFELDPVSPALEEAHQSGIPVILIDRKANSRLYTAFVGADNLKIGNIAGHLALNILKGIRDEKAPAILELTVPELASPFLERHNGFVEVVEPYLSDSVITEAYYSARIDDLRHTLLNNSNIRIIFAQTDIIGIKAKKIVDRLGLGDKISIIGIDGLAGPGGGMQAVADGVLTASILYPTGGEKAIQIAVDVLNDRYVKRNNELETTVINKDNVRLMMQQSSKISSQQNDIVRMNEKIFEQISIYRSQRNLIYIFSFTLVVGLILTAYVLKSRTEIQKINRRLSEQNEEISRQKDREMQMSKKIKETTQAKVRFFTNISHELKTPLTLILGPAERLLTELHGSPLKKEANLILSNAQRLLRLVNQLMEFRKIETGKLKLNVSQVNVFEFIEEIKESFSQMAESRKIDFRLLSDKKLVYAWIDKNMFDKVFFNLLINAFKFVDDHGRIHVVMDEDKSKNDLVIKFKDNGIGMMPEDAEKIFDRFYQVDSSKVKGTGIGLALSKELVELHCGKITVESVPDVGTVFTVTVKLGNSHFSKSEILPSHEKMELDRMDKMLSYQTDEAPEFLSSGSTSILLIEDNDDLRSYIAENLKDQYKVYEAINGEAGLTIAFDEVPDIIITDIGLPRIDGYEVIKTLKNDLRTSHIPIIALSAKDELDNKIKGIKYGADDYMTKPFSFQLLLERIHTIQINTQKLREHYLYELPPDRSVNPGELDRKFVNEFTSTVQQNITDPHLDVRILCEKLGLSKIQLYRKTKATTGYNVNEYIRNVRIKLARSILLSEDLPMSEIAHKSGYSSSSYFATIFKEEFGVTPSEYKKSRGAREAEPISKK